MTYATLMVHLEPGHSNSGLLQIAGDLAERFNANVIGVAARQPLVMVYGDGGYIDGDVIGQDCKETKNEMEAAEAEFRSALQTRVRTLAWRSAVIYTSLSDYLAGEACSADLIITSVSSGELFDASRRASTGDLIMRVGRPVLIVPAAADKLKLGHIVIGWKDTRETRRAAWDALPLLKKADKVTVVAIAGVEEMSAAHRHLANVLDWLKRHGIAAQSLAFDSTGDDTARLTAIVQEQGADLMVAGAYGHSRLREWVLGGVTRDLLLGADRCSLVSH